MIIKVGDVDNRLRVSMVSVVIINKAREKVADYFASHLLVPQAEFERIYALTQDVVKLKRHFRVSYLVILNRLAAMGIIEFAKEKAKICAIYQKQHHVKCSGNLKLRKNFTDGIGRYFFNLLFSFL